jgi:hypothetical protein
MRAGERFQCRSPFFCVSISRFLRAFLMLVFLIWQAGVALQVLLLVRAWASRSLARYPFFHAYVGLTLGVSIFGYIIFIKFPLGYPPVYWIGQYATLLAGCGVVVEIFSHVLTGFPGARKFARVASFLTFAAIFLLELLYSHFSSPSAVAHSEFAAERDIRCAQIGLLAAVVAIIVHYAISVAKGIIGMLYGYSLYLIVSLASLALRFYFAGRFDFTLRILQPLFFDVAIFIWTVALWKSPVSIDTPPDIPIEEDYEALALVTKGHIKALRAHVAKSVRR